MVCFTELLPIVRVSQKSFDLGKIELSGKDDFETLYYDRRQKGIDIIV